MAIQVPGVDTPDALRSAVASLPQLYAAAGELVNAAPQRRIRDAWRLWRPDNARRARVDAFVSDPDWRPDGPELGDVDHLLLERRDGWGRGFVDRRIAGGIGNTLPVELEPGDASPKWRQSVPAPRVSAMFTAQRAWHYWPALHDPVEALLWTDGHHDADDLSRAQRDAWGELRNALAAPALDYWQAYASALTRDIGRQPPVYELDDFDTTNAATGESRPAGELVGSASSSPAASTQALPTKGRPSWD